MLQRAVAVTTSVLLCAGLLTTSAVAAEPPAGPGPADYVEPVAWADFTAGRPQDAQAEKVRRMLLNTNRYALTTWYPQKYGSQGDEGYLDLGGRAEPHVRPPGSEAFTLAASLATGAYDESVVGHSAAYARQVAVRITTSVAHHHNANSGAAGWGPHWQSALWAYYTALAGWLLWDDLPPADQEQLARMVIAEADVFLDYRVPYYQDRDGTVLTPGDTKAEENAWNAAFLNLAVSMVPDHPNRPRWRAKALELMVSSYATQSDLRRNAVINGKRVRDWLNGSNMFEDGTVVNHGIIHPDYFTSISNNIGSPTVYALAGQPAPKAALFNADRVYEALVDREFAAPPHRAPGGTIYRRDEAGAATWNVYYPQGNDWGTHRQAHFMLLDTLADAFGLDEQTSVPAGDWAAAHLDRSLALQARFPDGRTYGAASEDTYAGREEWVALHAGRAYLIHWLGHNTDFEITNRGYSEE